jgi:hypothetical protein
MVDAAAISADNESYPSLLTGDQAIAFGGIHYKILMMTEEGYDYLLTGDTDQKKAFLNEFSSLPGDYAAFEKVVNLSSDETAQLMVHYEDLNAATDAIGTTAEAMFASYEADGTGNPDDVGAFKDAVTASLTSVDAIWAQNPAIDFVPMNEIFARGQLNTLLLEAIEESYAYPVLGDEHAKNSAREKFTEFDAHLALAREMNPDQSFEDLESAKEELMEAAETFFASYEAQGTVSADNVAHLENVVESFDETIVQLRAIRTGKNAGATQTAL